MNPRRSDDHRANLLQDAQRARNTIVTPTVDTVHRRTRGFTLLELCVTCALVGIVGSMALPRLRDASRYGAWNAQSQLISDLRHARSWAITTGDHFMLRIDDNAHYTIWRMALAVDGTWTTTGDPVRDRSLPDDVTVEAVDVGDGDEDGDTPQFEFDTRGMLVLAADAPAVAALVVHDDHIGASKRVSVWPSGQVAPL